MGIIWGREAMEALCILGVLCGSVYRILYISRGPMWFHV